MADVVNMPRLGLNENESLIGEWFVSEGDTVAEGAELFSIETDKSSMTVYAETSGTVLKKFYGDFDVVPVMTPVLVIGRPGEDISNMRPAGGNRSAAADAVPDSPKVSAAPVEAPAPQTQPAQPGGGPFPSPRARKLARVNGIDISGIAPSGAEGRILEKDVIAAMRKSPPVATQSETPVQPATAQDGARSVKMTRIRRTIAKNMMESLQNTAQLTSHAKYNASQLQKYRAWYKSSPGEEKSVTLTDMILFAVAHTLREFDYMNAHLVSDEELLYFDAVHLGCAVDTEKGLMVPTIRNADSLTLPELSRTLKELAEKCRSGSISPEEMSGATFTVSNLGGFGVTDFTPILNPPQVGILGVGAMDFAVNQTDEGMLCYPAGHLSLTYDHRSVDGAPSARFLQAVCRKLENFGELL